MIKVHLQYVRRAAGSYQEELRNKKVIELELLDTKSPVHLVLESGEICRWAKLLTGIDFGHVRFTVPYGRYRKTFKHGSDQYVFWLWKGTAPQPLVSAMYRTGKELAATDRITVRLEMIFGKGQRPHRAD